LDGNGEAGGLMKTVSRFINLVSGLCLFGCTGVPSGLEPVTGFDLDRYLGDWYEIARLDHSFERNMSNVSARYSRGDKGEIRVLNRGFDEKSGKWKDIEGRGHFIGDQKVGSLKVSFFGPFYGGYHIIALDKDSYRYAMVAGPKRSYLWILSRDKTLDKKVMSDLVSKARDWGFETDTLIYVKHDRDV
jgi:apolipoprotein D and lipocalin family protein